MQSKLHSHRQNMNRACKHRVSISTMNTQTKDRASIRVREREWLLFVCCLQVQVLPTIVVMMDEILTGQLVAHVASSTHCDDQSLGLLLKESEKKVTNYKYKLNDSKPSAISSQ